MRLFGFLTMVCGMATASLAQTTFTKIESMSGWHACSGCANAGGGATYSMVRGIRTPSLDGNSTRFSLGGTTPWSHALFYRTMSTNSTATNFVYDVHYYYKSASGSAGMEFSVSQRKGYKWYRWDTQCSYVYGNWRLWDSKYGRWVNTSIPCRRPCGKPSTAPPRPSTGRLWKPPVTCGNSPGNHPLKSQGRPMLRSPTSDPNGVDRHR